MIKQTFISNKNLSSKNATRIIKSILKEYKAGSLHFDKNNIKRNTKKRRRVPAIKSLKYSNVLFFTVTFPTDFLIFSRDNSFNIELLGYTSLRYNNQTLNNYKDKVILNKSLHRNFNF